MGLLYTGGGGHGDERSYYGMPGPQALIGAESQT